MYICTCIYNISLHITLVFCIQADSSDDEDTTPRKKSNSMVIFAAFTCSSSYNLHICC